MRSRFALALLLTAIFAACDDDGPTTPTRISSSGGGTSDGGTPTSVNLTGTWTGTSLDTAGGLRLTWQLTQTNRNVTGGVTATTPVGAPVYTSGSFNGTLSGTTMPFTITIPVGAVAGSPNCTVTLTGTAQNVTSTSLAGTYTGDDSCVGAILDGRLTMIKQ
jgi:hypothetical protein